jgi:hypothetical protein
MPNEPTAMQLCPTRVDRAPVLFAHKVTRSQCQDRQRGRYHKCFTCVHNNAYSALDGTPAAGTPAAARARREEVLSMRAG